MSLTLEEKQRLAKEQEQAAKLRNQPALAPQSIKPATPSTQAKDLTSSLLNNMTSLGSLSLTSPPRPGLIQSSTISAYPSTTPMGSMVSNGYNPTMGFQTGGLGMRPPGPGLYGGMATTTSTPNLGALTHNQGSTNTPDMSALDSLFTSNKPKVSLNQMAPPKPTPGTTATPWLNQFGSAQPSQTAPMQGAPLPMGGVTSGFGMQANPFFSPQNFSQPTSAPGMNTGGGLRHSSSVNNDLKDLFG